MSSISGANVRYKGYSKALSIKLDYLRAISALLVVLAHAYQIFVIPTVGLESNIHTFFVNIGWVSVNMFFILSGFVIYGALAKLVLNNNSPEAIVFDYGLSRISRLYPPLIFGLVISVFIYWILLLLFSPEYLGSINFRDYEFVIRDDVHISVYSVVCNLFFLQGVACAPLIINGPLWSLSYEFWFYVFAAGLFIVICNKRWWGVLVSLCPFLLFSLVGVEFQKFFLGFIIWLSGLWAGYCYHNDTCYMRVVSGYISIALAFAVSFLFFMSWCDDFIGLYFYIKVAFALFLSVLFFLLYIKEGFFVRMPFRDVLIKMSSSSYTLYLIHFPIMLGVFVVFNHFYRLVLFSALLLCLVSSVGCVLISYYVGGRIESVNIKNYFRASYS